MKLRTKIKITLFVCVAFFSLSTVQAQGYTKGYFSAGWQYGAPLSTGFADKGSGYGLFFDCGYYLNPFFSMGVFINHQKNYEYIPRQTYPVGETATVTTDQQHRITQLPFGVSMRYRFYTGMFQPYVGAKVGTNYTSTYSDFHTVTVYDERWGVHLSPEVGIAIFPFEHKRLGFNVSGYYSYSSNQNTLYNYELNGVNNAGFRLGLIF